MKKLLLLFLLTHIGQINAQCPVTITGNTVICSGGCTILTATGASTYTWAPSGFTSATNTACPTSNIVYTVTGTTGTCTATNTIAVNVIPAPSMTVTTPSPYCPGTMIPSPNITTTPSSGVNVSWTVSNVNIGMPASGVGVPAQYIAPTNTTLGDLVGIVTYTPDMGGCIGSVTNETITISATPIVDSIADIFVCSNNNISQTNLSMTPSNGVISFSWSSYNSSIGISNGFGNIPSFIAVDTSSVSSIIDTMVVFGSRNGCVSPDRYFAITIGPSNASFILQKDTSTLNTWDAYPIYSSNATSAKWYWGDGTSTAGFYPSHTYAFAGWYNICLTVYLSCGDSLSFCQNDSIYRIASNSTMISVNVVPNATNINPATSLNNGLLVYPNPTSDQFFIDANTNDKLIVDLYDVNGRHVFSKIVSDKENINVADLNEGVYTLTIKMADRVINKKLIILR